MSDNNSNNIYNLPDDQIKMPGQEVSQEVEPTKKRSLVPFLLIIVLLLVGLLGGLLYWGWDIIFPSELIQPETNESVESETEETAPVTEATTATEEPSPANSIPLSTSDEITDIETDLINTDINNLDQEVAELQAIFSN